MKVAQEISINKREMQKKEITKPTYYNPFFQSRKNNRKNTKARRVQFITCVNDSVFPPLIWTKTIKHLNK
jgi:hypothetical protein